MEFLHTNKAPAAIGPYSQAVKVNGMLYTSGQIALTPSGEMIENDIKKQTIQIFENLKAILDASNSSFNDVIKVGIFLTDMNDFGIVNVIMTEVFGDHKPVRSTIAVKTLPKNAMLEMDIIALARD
ncbi:MAG: RidA family protein [Arcobacteraceae bacterium]|jgi:2-iminobutanoate/2-iminopropanoate deaminase